MMNTLLEQRAIAPLRQAIGLPLTSVVYWCLDGEAEQHDIVDPSFYFGGEIELSFGATHILRMSWGENAGWPTSHFSLIVSEKSAFIPGCLKPFDASKVQFWQPHIGQPLLAATFSGCDGVPYVGNFHFPSGNVLAGISYETSFGEGDDVFVALPEATLKTQVRMTVLWDSRIE